MVLFRFDLRVNTTTNPANPHRIAEVINTDKTMSNPKNIPVHATSLTSHIPIAPFVTNFTNHNTPPANTKPVNASKIVIYGLRKTVTQPAASAIIIKLSGMLLVLTSQNAAIANIRIKIP